jgi:hypothetical protein
MPALALTAGMRTFLARFGQPLAIAILIGLAVVVIDQRGFNRAKAQDQARENERALIIMAVVGAIDGKLDQRLAKISADVGRKLETIDKEGKTVEPLIRSELARNPRLADPGSCLTPGLLEAVNRARGYPAGAELGAPGAGDPPGVRGSPARH